MEISLKPYEKKILNEEKEVLNRSPVICISQAGTLSVQEPKDTTTAIQAAKGLFRSHGQELWQAKHAIALKLHAPNRSAF